MGAALQLENCLAVETHQEKLRPQLKLVVGGAFLQKDPDPGKLAVPASVINAYIYVRNNPTLYTDPSGKIVWFDAIPLISAVVGAISGGVWAAFTGENILKAMGVGALTGLAAGLGAVGLGGHGPGVSDDVLMASAAQKAASGWFSADTGRETAATKVPR